MNKIGDLESIKNVLAFEGPHKFVCQNRPKDYSYYQKYDISWSDLGPYQV